MKVKDLLKHLEGKNPEAYVEIQTENGFTEDIKKVVYHESEEYSDVVILTSLIK